MIQRGNGPARKRIQLTITVMILTSLVYGCLVFWQPTWLFHRREFRDGNLIVKRVDAFRAARGRLPNSLEEVNLQGLSDRVFYQKTDADHYEVWFSIALGESEVYDSASKQWR
jgi:hypothetical protein